MTQRTAEELNRFLARMRSVIERRQRNLADSEHEPERWFSGLRLASAEIDQDKATFLFADDTDGRRYGYRWWLWYEEDDDALADPEEALSQFSTDLLEDVATRGAEGDWPYRAGPPDGNGVQWIGEDPPDPTVELGDLERRLRDVVLYLQRVWKDSEHEPERRFSELWLYSHWIDRNAAWYLLADKVGYRYGYRWPIWDGITADRDRAARLFADHLQHDVRRLGHGEPDADGIRWFNEDRDPKTTA